MIKSFKNRFFKRKGKVEKKIIEEPITSNNEEKIRLNETATIDSINNALSDLATLTNNELKETGTIVSTNESSQVHDIKKDSEYLHYKITKDLQSEFTSVLSNLEKITRDNPVISKSTNELAEVETGMGSIVSKDVNEEYNVYTEIEKQISNLQTESQSVYINTNIRNNIDENMNRVDSKALNAKSNELIKFPVNDITKVIDKVKIDIKKMGLDEFSKDYILNKYIESGLDKIDARLLLDLQEMNFNKLDIKTVIHNEIPSAYLKNLWFNEIILECLFQFKIQDQTMLLIRNNIVDQMKVSATQVVIDNILFNKKNYSDIEISSSDLYYEYTIKEMSKVDDKMKIEFYNIIHKELNILRNALNNDNNTLKSTGEIFGVTRERVRQIESKYIVKLQSLTRDKVEHLNPNFLLGLNNLALTVLKHKKIEPDTYFTEGIIKPTKYFIEEYKLNKNYYIYNEKVIPKYNQFLFNEFMLNLDNGVYHVSDILDLFLSSLKANNIYDEVMNKDLVDVREIEGRLNRMSGVIKSNGKMYRKHHVSDTDIELIIETIEELDLPNVFSSRLFMNLDEVVAADINDENELHYILKNNQSKFKMNVVFGRTPHMSIGKCDYIDELTQIVDSDLLVTNPNQAIIKLSEITGIKSETIEGTYIKKIIANTTSFDFSETQLSTLEEKLLALEEKVIHVEVLKEKYSIQFSNDEKEQVKRVPIANYQLRGNWLIHVKYESLHEFILDNLDEYGIFNESLLGASRFVHNYTNFRKTLRMKNVYRFNNDELIYIKDENVLRNIKSLIEDVLYGFELPYSVDALLESDNFNIIIERNSLEEYGFSNIFWQDVLTADESIKLDGKILVDKLKPIDYMTYIEGFSCSIYEYEEYFKECVGCEPPPKYINKILEKKAFIKDDVIYLKKEIYLNELRSVL